MYRFVLAGLIGVFGAALGLLWWSQVAPPTAPPSEIAVAGRSAPSTVAWTPDAPLIHIQADAEAESARALGLAHGLRHAWTMVLWRQTARGRLSRWLSDSAVSFDRHARQMGWARAAQTYIAQLPRADREWLAAYASGVNAAFSTAYVRQQPTFAALDAPPSPWAPWHTLAVEHLLTWMATDVPALPDSAAPAVHQSADSLRTVDEELRTWLGLHGWSDAMAWVLNPGDSGAPYLGARWPRGSTPDALVAPVWHTTAADTAWITTVPGTRWTLAHHTRTASRVLLPRGRASWQPLAAPDTIRRATERLRQRDGHELLVHTAFTGSGRIVGPEAPPALSPNSSLAPTDGIGSDSTQVDNSRADSTRTDSTHARSTWMLTLPYWSEVPAQHRRFPEPASLPHHDPLVLRHDTDLTTAGATQAIRDAEGDSVGVVLSASPWRRAWADRFSDYADAGRSVHAWAVDDTSTWAQQTVAPLQTALDAHPPTDSLSRAVAPFIRNWDGVFAPSSIGASIFQAWWHEMQASRVSPVRLDTTAYFALVRYRRGFERAVARLREQHGPDVQQWRWEAVQPHRFQAPLWGTAHGRLSAASSPAAHDTPTASIPGRGHISTLAPGPNPEAAPPAAGYHLYWTRAGAQPPYYRTTDLARTLADRLVESPDARINAYQPVPSPSVEVRLTAP